MSKKLIDQEPFMTSPSVTYSAALLGNRTDGQPVLSLILKLCQTLAAEDINYCHWKSNEAIARSASGDNDLDLLVSRADAQRFTEILFRLGFREAESDAAHSLPGVLNYYGYDEETQRLIHVHTHYQLVLGNDLSKNYRIPLEAPYLASATQSGLFRVPAPEFELVIFVIRMVLKHSTWDSMLIQQGKLSPSEGRELHSLATTQNLERVPALLQQYLPYVDQALFDACLKALYPGHSLARRIATGERLQRALEACARHPQSVDIISKLARRVGASVDARILHRKPGRRMANGGLLIAIVGGDGSGKSTAIDGLYSRLSQKFDVRRLHMGKPNWSWTTIAIRGLLKIGTMLGLSAFVKDSYDENAKFPGYAYLIRAVCNARDRYLSYLKARRFASNGGLVICDRYPLPGLLAMDAPQCARVARISGRSNGFLKWLIALEDGYYKKIARPDLLIVLKINPQIAVQRKVEESEASVRRRSSLVWDLDWSNTPAHVLDAGLPKDEILAQIQSLVWSHL